MNSACAGHVWHCSCACAGASHVVWHELGYDWLLGWCSGFFKEVQLGW